MIGASWGQPPVAVAGIDKVKLVSMVEGSTMSDVICAFALVSNGRSEIGRSTEPSSTEAARSSLNWDELAGILKELCLEAPDDWVEAEEEGDDEALFPEGLRLGFFFLVMMNGREEAGMGAGFRRRERRRRWEAKELTFVG